MKHFVSGNSSFTPNRIALTPSPIFNKDTYCMQLHEDHEEMRRLQKKMDAARNIGKAVWESTGFGVIPYADPFPTGIDKRTPTGGFFSS